MARSITMLVASLNDTAKNSPETLAKEVKILGFDTLHNLIHTDVLTVVLVAIKLELKDRETAIIKSYKQGTMK